MESLTNIKIRFERILQLKRVGLPSWRTVLYPLVVLFITFILLVSFGITGSSTGQLHGLVSFEPDERLLFGYPKAIRSDEWLVHSGWVISQFAQGMPLVNQAILGGFSSSFLQEIPSFHWTIAFKPQLWGFFFLPFDQAVAFKWWLPIFSLISAAFFFFVSLSPSRPMSGMLFAIAFAVNPFLQWWFFSGTFFPPAWALFAAATVIWAVRGATLLMRLVLGAFLGYSLVGMAMGLYVPFILTAVLPALAFSFGLLFERSWPHSEVKLKQRIVNVLPLLFGLLLGALTVAFWLYTNSDLVQAFTGTVYPGERKITTGLADIGSWISLMAAPFSLSILGGATLPILGPNSSEAATFFLPGLFLLVPIVWLAMQRLRNLRKVDWVVTSQLLLLLVTVAFLALPGWDTLASYLFLDLVPPTRFRMLFGVMSFILVALFVERIDRSESYSGNVSVVRLPHWVKISAPALALASIVILWLYFRFLGPGVAIGSIGTKISALLTMVIVLGFVASLAMLVWRKVLLASIFLLLTIFTTTALVNPVYIGLYRLTDTEVSRYVQSLSADDENATWVAVGGYLPSTVIIHAGVTGLNGVQSVPQLSLWKIIDPNKKHELAWNRLGNISWVPGEGSPVPQNPVPDQIQLNFDSCSSFAQNNVSYVISENTIEQACLLPKKQFKMGPANFYVYSVISK